MKTVQNDLSSYDYREIVNETDGFSSADLNSLCKDAAMEPVREIPANQLLAIKGESSIRKVKLKDFIKALKTIRPSVSKASLMEYSMWHKATSHI